MRAALVCPMSAEGREIRAILYVAVAALCKACAWIELPPRGDAKNELVFLMARTRTGGLRAHVAAPSLLRADSAIMVTVLSRYLDALATEPPTVRLAVQEALSTLQPLYVPLPPHISTAMHELMQQHALSVRARPCGRCPTQAAGTGPF